jgi:hypothetical protein
MVVVLFQKEAVKLAKPVAGASAQWDNVQFYNTPLLM